MTEVTAKHESSRADPKLRISRLPSAGRDEDKDDVGAGAVTCFEQQHGLECT